MHTLFLNVYNENSKANRKLLLDRAVFYDLQSQSRSILIANCDVGIELERLIYVYSYSYRLDADIAFNSVFWH